MFPTRLCTIPTNLGGKGLSYTVYPEQEDSVDLKKTPLVLAHGVFGSKELFDSVSKQISIDGRKVFVYDARNHGDSQQSTEFNYSSMADDLSDMIHNLGLTDPIIMGHSMGGKTVMTLALSKPETIKAMIVIDITPLLSPSKDVFLKYSEAMKAMRFREGISLAEAYSQAKAELAKTVLNPQILDYFMTNLTVGEDGQIKWRDVLDAFLNNADELELTYPEDGNVFTKPALFIFGENSVHCSAVGFEKVKALFPKAEIVTIKDAGHFLYDDKPAEFVAAVRRFCDGLDA